MTIKAVGVCPVIAVLVFALAGCGGQHGPTAPGSGASSSSEVAATSDRTADRLEVTPSDPRSCDTHGAVVATVSWSATRPQIKIMVVNVGQPIRLFSQGGFAGQATTGPWVVAGTQFSMVDAASGVTLATAVLSNPQCAR